MAQNIFEDLSRKPVARALRPAATMTYLKLTFAVAHRSPIRRIWTNRQLATHYCTRIASDLSLLIGSNLVGCSTGKSAASLREDIELGANSQRASERLYKPVSRGTLRAPVSAGAPLLGLEGQSGGFSGPPGAVALIIFRRKHREAILSWAAPQWRDRWRPGARSRPPASSSWPKATSKRNAVTSIV